MNLFKPPNSSLHGISRALRTFISSTDGFASSSSSSSSSRGIPHTLHTRLSSVAHPNASLIPVLEKWLNEGNTITHSDLETLIRNLRKRRHFFHALQVSEWVSAYRQSRYCQSPVGLAVRLDLISKVHGLEKAEEYFNSIPPDLRTLQVYGSLLNCYAHDKLLEKAEAVMQKMRELGFTRTVLCYNIMLNLYRRLKLYEKLDILAEEMDQKGIKCDLYSFVSRLNGYIATSKFEEMEKLLMKMEADPLLKMDWHAYTVVATGYLKAGVIDKTLTMLKKAERLVNLKYGKSNYDALLTLYAAAGSKDDVYRIWNLYRDAGKCYNSIYQCMISSLMKLDDIDGAERIWEEWLSGNKNPDITIPNLMIGAYSSKGLWKKAEEFVNMIIQRGIEPGPGTWDRLAMGYSKVGQMEKAVETIKKAISTSKPGWKPTFSTLAKCVVYLKGQEDMKAAEELLEIVTEHCRFPTYFVNRLQESIKQENLSINSLDQIEDADEILSIGNPSTLEFEDKGSAVL